jgi:hypothetical protein
MRKLQVWLIVGILTLALAGLAWGQAAAPAPAPGPGAGPKGAARMYNPATVETLGGEVVGVRVRTPRRAAAPGGGMTEITLKTDKETIPVHLGPAWYLDQQNFKIAQGDRVEVTGSRLTRPRRTFIVAAEVKKGPEVLKLRDAQGLPLWPRGGGGR